MIFSKEFVTIRKSLNPYLALETVVEMAEDARLGEIETQRAVENFIQGVEKGLLKIFSRMGISIVRSYRGAQIFEAVGLEKNFIEQYFPWTTSRIGGIGLETVIRETLARHEEAYSESLPKPPSLRTSGEYRYRRQTAYYCTEQRSFIVKDLFDHSLWNSVKDKIASGEKVAVDARINNTMRSIGAYISGNLAREFANRIMAPESIVLNLRGSAGQSFGALSSKKQSWTPRATSRLTATT